MAGAENNAKDSKKERLASGAPFRKPLREPMVYKS